MFRSFFCIVIGLTCAMSRAEGTRGGGDEVALEFHAAFQQAKQNLLVRQPDLVTSQEWSQLDIKLAEARILVVNRPLLVTLNGVVQESIATNNPVDNTIEINRTRWKAITDNHLKEAVTLHEIRSLLGLESTGHYPVSGRYLALFALSPSDLYRTYEHRNECGTNLEQYNRIEQWLLKRVPDGRPNPEPNLTQLRDPSFGMIIPDLTHLDQFMIEVSGWLEPDNAVVQYIFVCSGENRLTKISYSYRNKNTVIGSSYHEDL